MQTDLVIRAILLKNNEVIYNYSFRIQGTDNVHDSTIAAANKVCNLFLGITLKGDTMVSSLGAGHNSAHIYITRNVHISNFINTLHKIKDKTGLYIIITASKYDWLEYAGGNTTYEDFFITPNKGVIKGTVWGHKLIFSPFSHILFLPGRKKLKFCSYPAEKSSSFVLTWPKKTHILFWLGPKKTQVFTYKRAFLTYGGSFRMEKYDKPSNYDPI